MLPDHRRGHGSLCSWLDHRYGPSTLAAMFRAPGYLCVGGLVDLGGLMVGS